MKPLNSLPQHPNQLLSQIADLLPKGRMRFSAKIVILERSQTKLSNSLLWVTIFVRTVLMKLFVCVLLPFLSLGCTAEHMIHRVDGSRISHNELSSRIQTLMDSAQVSGLAISILNPGEVAYQAAFGYANVDTGDTLRTDHIFYGASFSKAVFAYLVAQLVEEGVLDLDRPLQEYLDRPLPDYPFEKEWRGYADLKDDLRYEQLTARMCMTHTTGFPNWRWLSKEFDFDPEGKIRFLIDPGSRYSYSGEGINLLQFVIEQITGKGLEELAQERIFRPLQMNMTSYVWQKRFEGRYCHGHTTTEEVLPKDSADEAGAAGSMETTLEDYTRFTQKMMRLVQADSPVTEILFAPSVRIRSKRQFGFQAWEDTDENDEIELSYALGWGWLNTPYGWGVFKEGHGEGFQHYSILFPQQEIGIILLTNSDNGESIFKAVLETAIGDTFTPWKWELYLPYDLKNT